MTPELHRNRAPWLAALLLSACSHSQDPAPQAAPITGLQTLTVAAPSGGLGRPWDGVVEAVQQADLSAQTSGRVVAVERDVDDPVSQGELLVRLSAVEQQSGVNSARAALRAAEAALVEAAATHRRFVELSERQFVSQSQLDQVSAAHDAAAAARDAAKARLAEAGQQADHTTIRAPFDGIVAARHVEPGESVAPGQPLLSVFAPTALRIEVSLPQSDAQAVRQQPEARIAFGDGREVAAADVIVFPSADPATHSIKVRVQLPELSPWPLPGSTAKVRFPAVADAGYPLLPRSALVRRGEVDAVYVLQAQQLSLRQLRLGAERGEQVEVISGIAPGETVATDPVAALQALQQARAGAR